MKQTETLLNLTSVKKLKGYDAFYRIRVGDYRLGFAISGNTIVLVRFLHRKEMYRFFPLTHFLKILYAPHHTPHSLPTD